MKTSIFHGFSLNISGNIFNINLLSFTIEFCMITTFRIVCSYGVKLFLLVFPNPNDYFSKRFCEIKFILTFAVLKRFRGRGESYTFPDVIINWVRNQDGYHQIENDKFLTSQDITLRIMTNSILKTQKVFRTLNKSMTTTAV